MSINTIFALSASMLSLALAVAGACRQKHSLATWCFSVGMLVLGLENFFGAMWREASVAENMALWGSLTLAAKSIFPAVWICFSVTYSRGNTRTLPSRLRSLVGVALLLPLGITLICRQQLLSVYAGPHAD